LYFHLTQTFCSLTLYGICSWYYIAVEFKFTNHRQALRYVTLRYSLCSRCSFL